MKEANEGMDHVVIGRLLKATREENGNTQLDIAKALGYRNVNFIYLIEQGRANIPVAKIPDIIKAYKIDRYFALAIVKNLHPDIWRLFTDIIMINKKELQDFPTFERKINEVYREKAEEHGLILEAV